MCASNSHSYTHLIQALGIVREPKVWGFITSKYLGTHDIGLPSVRGNTPGLLRTETPVKLNMRSLRVITPINV